MIDMDSGTEARIEKWIYENMYITKVLNSVRLDLTRIADSLEIIANAHIHEDDKN